MIFQFPCFIESYQVRFQLGGPWLAMNKFKILHTLKVGPAQLLPDCPRMWIGKCTKHCCQKLWNIKIVYQILVYSNLKHHTVTYRHLTDSTVVCVPYLHLGWICSDHPSSILHSYLFLLSNFKLRFWLRLGKWRLAAIDETHFSISHQVGATQL